jgi:hypothetical protein
MSDSQHHIPYATPTSEHERREVDNRHLTALVICTYIWGGLAAIASLIPLIHVGIGAAILSGAIDGQSANPPPPFLGWMFIFLGSGAILLGETLAALNLYSAWQMSRRKGRMFSMVIAGINCISVPLGTLLGVFTIIVLSRDSVGRQYAQGPAGQHAFPVGGRGDGGN